MSSHIRTEELQLSGSIRNPLPPGTISDVAWADSVVNLDGLCGTSRKGPFVPELPPLEDIVGHEVVIPDQEVDTGIPKNLVGTQPPEQQDVGRLKACPQNHVISQPSGVSGLKRKSDTSSCNQSKRQKTTPSPYTLNISQDTTAVIYAGHRNCESYTGIRDILSKWTPNDRPLRTLLRVKKNETVEKCYLLWVLKTIPSGSTTNSYPWPLLCFGNYPNSIKGTLPWKCCVRLCTGNKIVWLLWSKNVGRIKELAQTEITINTFDLFSLVWVAPQ